MTPDSQVRNGSRFSIKCKLFTTEAKIKGRMQSIDSTNIVFDFEGKRIPGERITIEDSMTASINFDSLKVSDSGAYWCSIQTPSSSVITTSSPALQSSSSHSRDLSMTSVCSMHLEVGLPPTSIGSDRMHCISLEYENLTCSWSPPNYNTRTNYTLAYYYGRSTGAVCPLPKGTSCTWTTSTEPHYRQFVKKLDLVLHTSNLHGKKTEHFSINHFEIIKPGEVEDFFVSNVTFDGFNISWKVPHAFDFGSHLETDTSIPKLIYQVEVEPVFRSLDEDEDDEQEVPSRLVLQTQNHSLMVHEGILPNTEYRIKIRSKTQEAKNDTFWSVWLTNKALTKPAAPFRSPVIHQTFHSVVYGDKKRNITVYWKPLSHWERNGPGFYYGLEVEAAPSVWMLQKSSQGNDVSSVLFTRKVESYKESSFVLSGLSTELSYKITAFSANDYGSTTSIRSTHTNGSTLLIARESDSGSVSLEAEGQMSDYYSGHQKESDQISSLESIKPIGVEVFFYGSSRYEVRWNHPRRLHSGHCESYTISWCPNDRLDDDYLCSGALKTEVVPANRTLTAHTIDMIEEEVNVTDKHSSNRNRHYQFGVSTNYRAFPSISQRLTRSPVTDGLLLSSGLSWTSCVIPIGIKKLEKIHAFQARSVNHTAIKLSWQLPCQGLQSVISKYEVSFCETNMNHTCQVLNNLSSEMNRTELQGGTHRQVVISDLKPETAYRFVLRAWTTDTPGEESEAVVESTQSLPTSLILWLIKIACIVVCILVTHAIIVFAWKRYRKFQDEIRVPIELPGKFAHPTVKLTELNQFNRSHEDDDDDENNSLALKMNDGMITVTTDSDSMDGMVFSASRMDKPMFHTDSGQGTDSSSESSEHLVNHTNHGLEDMDFSGSSLPDEQETSFVSSIVVSSIDRNHHNYSNQSSKYSTEMGDNDYAASDIAFPTMIMKDANSITKNGHRPSYVSHKDLLLQNSRASSNRESRENSFSEHHPMIENPVVIPDVMTTATSSAITPFYPSNAIMSSQRPVQNKPNINPISVPSSSSINKHNIYRHQPLISTLSSTGGSIVSSTGTLSPESLPFSSSSSSSSNDAEKHASFIKGSNGYVFLPSQLPLTRI